METEKNEYKSVKLQFSQLNENWSFEELFYKYWIPYYSCLDYLIGCFIKPKSVKSAELREEAKTITKNLCERSQKIANGPFICMQPKIWKLLQFSR